MIINFNELKKYRHGVTMVDGCFDPLHEGHIRYFEAASRLALPILCNIASDQYLKTKHAPFLQEKQRAEIIDSIRYINFTHISQLSTAAVLEELQPRYYVKGKDWRGRLPKDEIEVCHQHGIEIVYVDTILDSSSRILQQWGEADNIRLEKSGPS